MHGVIDEQKARFMNPNFPPTIIGGSAYYRYIRELEFKLDNGAEDLLILDGGNFFQGHPLGIVDSGKTMIKWMNKINYDAMVPGNNDFIYGYKNLIELSGIANFPFLASNILYADSGEYVFDPYTIIDINGVEIGIIGVVSSEMENIVLKKNIEGIIFTSEVESVNKYARILKEKKIDIIIVLSSLGIPWNRDKVYKKFIALNDSLQRMNTETDPSIFYREYIRENNQKLNRDYDFNSLALGYFTDDVDFIVSSGISKGYRTPWYDKNNHVYIFQNYGNGTEFGHFKIKYDVNNFRFRGYENVVSNSITQTLFIDDFKYDNEQFFWIKDRNNESINKVYEDIDWFSKIEGDKQILSEQYQNKIDLELDNNKANNNLSNWNIPNINTDMIDVITWNCEFFPTFGDSTIEALSEAVIDLNPEIIAFQEIKQRGWFDKLMDRLPSYNYVISEQSSFMDQAVIYKKDSFDLVNRMELFAEDDYNFAGRPPLKCDLIYRPSNKKISLINLHMKCCDSGLNRRKKASEMLYDYLNDKIDDKDVEYIILGDWNDDLKDPPGEHCFDPFLNDSRYFFPTFDIVYDLSQATYPKEPYVSFLDHILVTTSIIEKNNDYIVKTLPFDKYMGSFEIYEKYISDHMPVLFSFK